VRFRLKGNEAVSTEIRRIVLKQLDLATSELTSIGDPESDDAIHQARRRVKKIRAVIRLVRPVLNGAHRTLDPDLRRVSKLLAPVADGQGVIGTLNELARRYPDTLPRKTVDRLRADLVNRGRLIDLQADADHVLQKASRVLRSHRRSVKNWRLTAEGFNAIAPGLKQCVRRARRAMVVAWLHPTPARFHAWRRHVKAHWFHVRLLEGRCGDQLMSVQRRLEALDGILGEYHNLALLHKVLVSDTALSHGEVVRCRRVVTRYQRALRRHAQLLGLRVYSEKPRRFVRQVKRLWQSEIDENNSTVRSQHASSSRVRRTA
jgi:CHAD domain-containing protein